MSGQFIDFGSEEGRERLLRAFRYAQVGHCVSSITHDVNNALATILANADLLEMSTELDPACTQMLGQITGSVGKSTSLLSGLSGISRIGKENVSLIDVSQWIGLVAGLKLYDLRLAHIAIEKECDAGLPAIMGDKTKLDAALLCLLMNAAEALEGTAAASTGEKTIRITARNALDDVDVAVWNTGPAIPGDIQEAMFTPFFTTKGGGHLGLGLSVAQSIVEQHHGRLTYVAARGFVLSLPKDPERAR